jgi:hypothetical protein
MIHDPLCILGGPCRSTESTEHWEIWRVAGMDLDFPICEACVGYCDCVRVQAIRADQQRKDRVAVLEVTGYYPELPPNADGTYSQEAVNRIVDYVVATCGEQIERSE